MRLNERENMMRWLSIPLLSLMLGLSGCAATYPPCHRSDITPAYAADGTPLPDALTISITCVERIQGDLAACYQEAK